MHPSHAVLMLSMGDTDKPVLVHPDAEKTIDELPVDEVTGRPMWKNMVVPWITRWTGERCQWPISVLLAESGMHIAYGDPRKSPYGFMHAFTSQRDELGLLWLRERTDREGWGAPQFSQVQAARARQSVMERRCQVCGRAFEQGEETTFLVASDKNRSRTEWTGEPFTIAVPPVCLTCIPVTMRQCPEQARKPRSIIYARAFRPWQAVVDVVGPGGIEDPGVFIDLDDPRKNHSICKQLTVLVSDYDEEYL